LLFCSRTLCPLSLKCFPYTTLFRSVSEMESYRDLILENIEYDHLCREFTTYREDLDEIVELMVETVCAKRKTTRIAGSDFPHEVVRSRFLKLDSSHIEFVMECLRNNTTEEHYERSLLPGHFHQNPNLFGYKAAERRFCWGLPRLRL